MNNTLGNHSCCTMQIQILLHVLGSQTYRLYSTCMSSDLKRIVYVQLAATTGAAESSLRPSFRRKTASWSRYAWYSSLILASISSSVITIWGAIWNVNSITWMSQGFLWTTKVCVFGWCRASEKEAGPVNIWSWVEKEAGSVNRRLGRRGSWASEYEAGLKRRLGQRIGGLVRWTWFDADYWLWWMRRFLDTVKYKYLIPRK